MADELKRSPMAETTRFEEKTPCPFCGYGMDAATQLRDAAPDESGRPAPGDISICLNCAEVLIFGDDLKPRRPSLHELIDAQRGPNWPMVSRAQRIIQQMHQMKRGVD